MCIIAYAEGRKLTKEEFKNCFTNNPDGVGMCWNDGDNYRYIKGISKCKQAWKIYQKEVGDKLPHVVHFRIASTGGIKPELTHPFICNETSPIQMEYSGKDPLLFQPQL